MFVTGPSLPDPTSPQVVVGMLSGLALFLLGMAQLTEGLRDLAGDRLKTALARVTRNRFVGATTGASLAALLQSSSAATVLVVGFLSAGLLSLEQALGVIMGANVGTTITAQVIAFDVGRPAVAMAIGGFMFSRLAPRGPYRQCGGAVFGLGLVFCGMLLMSESAGALRHHEGFLELLAGVRTPGSALLVGALFTALVQSSTATVGVVIVLAGQGLVTLEPAVALLFGANIGTCVTAGLAAWRKPRPAVQAALGHLLFNMAGVLIWLPVLEPLCALVRRLSPQAPAGLPIADQVAAELPRQVANAHAVFNVGTMLVLLAFARPLAELIRRIVPDGRDGPRRA